MVKRGRGLGLLMDVAGTAGAGLTDVGPPCSRYGTTVGGAGSPVWPRSDRDRCGSKRAADKALTLPWGTEGSRWPSASTCCAADRHRGTPYAGESPCRCRRARRGRGLAPSEGFALPPEAHAAKTVGAATAAGGEGGVHPHTPTATAPTPGEAGLAGRPHAGPPTESPPTASARAGAGHRRGREGRVTPRGLGGAFGFWRVLYSAGD